MPLFKSGAPKLWQRHPAFIIEFLNGRIITPEAVNRIFEITSSVAEIQFAVQRKEKRVSCKQIGRKFFSSTPTAG
jgi:hypothetical protein